MHRCIWLYLFVSFSLLHLGCSPAGGGRRASGAGSGGTADASSSPDGADDTSGTTDGDTGGTTDDGTADTGGDTGDTETTGEGTDTGDTSEGDSLVLDPRCIDGQYTEELPDAGADISDLISGFSAAGYKDFLVAVLDRRYPIGAYLVENTIGEGVNGTNQDCVEFFLQSFGTGSASQVMSGLGTVVHECGHVWDMFIDFFNTKYQITDTLVFSCKDGGSQFGGKTFARSRIKGDDYSALHTPCKSFSDNACEDSYAGIYLNGDPDDAQFDSGDQGFDTLLEETVQYVNSLAVAYAFADQSAGFGSSDRDGILTFLWYLERYLRLARLEYPQAYQLLSGDPCWRDVILTTWGRGWMFLDLTASMPQLGIQDTKIEGLVLDPELLEEIQRIRDASSCPWD